MAEATVSETARILALPTGLTAPVPAQRMPAGRPRHNVVRLRQPRPAKHTAAPLALGSTLPPPTMTLEQAVALEIQRQIDLDVGALELLHKTIRDFEFKIATGRARLLHHADAQQRRISLAP